MDDLIRWRRDLHRIPELGLKEEKTAQYIRQELEKMGYQWQPILNTGTLVFIDYHQTHTIAFRSDIDGLKVTEKNNVDYVSQHRGYMHSCGHDGHMSALLGLAKKLKEKPLSFHNNVLLIFQPAEESPGAAKWIVEQGVFEKYHVQAIFGMHLMPLIDEGLIACKAGALMAMCGELDVKIKGRSTHAGLPQKGIDSIVVACQAIESYQHIISRFVSPFQPAIIHCGKITGGTTRNSMAQETIIQGTIRCYDEELFDSIHNHLQRIHQGLEEAYGCQIEWQAQAMYPPVNNDENLYAQFKKIVPTQMYVELKEPLMLAEDFAFYQRQIPGLFFFVGTRCEQFHSDLHSETFDFHETVLLQAVELYYHLLEKL